VSIKIGTLLDLRISRQVPRPSISGISKSSTTTSGMTAPSSKYESASSPSFAASTS